MSISRVQSGRHDGTVTESASPEAVHAKPMGSMSERICSAVNDAPSKALTRVGRTAMTVGVGMEELRASTIPS